MTTTVDYEVHSCVEADVEKTVKLGERDVNARLPGVVIELIGNGHGHTFRLVPESAEHLAEMRAMFEPGKRVRVTFESL